MIFEDRNITTVVIRTTNGIFKNFCYVVFDKFTKAGVLIDPSWEIDKIDNVLQEHQVIVRQVLLTHHHHDHINLSDHYTHTTGAKAWISEEEYNYYNPPLKNINLLRRGQIVNFGEEDCLTIFTPGHTAGSSCFKIRNHLFSGDTIFPEGCGICTCHGGNAYEMYRTIQFFKQHLHEEVRLFPGHSYGTEPGSKFGIVLKTNIYLQLEDEDSFVKFRMRKDQKDFMEFH